MAQPDEKIARCMLTTDHFGAVRELQTSWSQSTGQTFEQCEKWGWIYAIQPEHRNWVHDQWKQIVSHEKASTFPALLLNASLGEYEPTNFVCTPLFGEAGKVRHWIVTVFVDDLQTLNRHYGSIYDAPHVVATPSHVKKRAASTKKGNPETHLEDLQCIEKLASHDLRSPLRKIGNYASLVLEDMYENSPPVHQERMLQLLNSVDRMQRYVDGLQEYVALAIRPVHVRRISASQSLAHAIGSLAEAIVDTRTVISSHELPMVWANANLLQQVFEALLRNAIENCSEVTPLVKINCQREGETVTIEFLDRGAGIEPAERDAIFQPFRRGKNRSTLAGIGLGLAFCKRALLKMGGDLRLKETEKGACFAIQLGVALKDESAPVAIDTSELLQPIG